MTYQEANENLVKLGYETGENADYFLVQEFNAAHEMIAEFKVYKHVKNALDTINWYRSPVKFSLDSDEALDIMVELAKTPINKRD